MNVTPNGKQISVLLDRARGNYKIQFDSGGELPTALSGIFTSIREATTAINSYLARKQKKDGK